MGTTALFFLQTASVYEDRASFVERIQKDEGKPFLNTEKSATPLILK